MTYYIRSMCLPNVALAWDERFIILVLSISFFASHFLPSPFFSLPPKRNSDPGSRSRFFSPSTHYGSCFAFFIARRFQLSPRRLASNMKTQMKTHIQEKALLIGVYLAYHTHTIRIYTCRKIYGTRTWHTGI